MKPAGSQAKDHHKASLSRTISLRLDEASLLALQEVADALNLTLGELAKQCVLERLQVFAGETETAKPNYQSLLDGIHATYDHLIEARRDIALGVRILLSRAGQVTDDQALEWVKKNYPIACSPSQPQ